MPETLKLLVETYMLRGSYVTADEKPMESPLDFILWLAYQQMQRNARQNNHLEVAQAATEELG